MFNKVKREVKRGTTIMLISFFAPSIAPLSIFMSLWPFQITLFAPITLVYWMDEYVRNKESLCGDSLV